MSNRIYFLIATIIGWRPFPLEPVTKNLII
jgi:hypothetical protein